MSRYYFNLNHSLSENDESGVVFADVARARLAAVEYVGELLKDHPEQISSDRDFHIAVTDAQGEPVFRLDISAFVPSSAGS